MTYKDVIEKLIIKKCEKELIGIIDKYNLGCKIWMAHAVFERYTEKIEFEYRVEVINRNFVEKRLKISGYINSNAEIKLLYLTAGNCILYDFQNKKNTNFTI